MGVYPRTILSSWSCDKFFMGPCFHLKISAIHYLILLTLFSGVGQTGNRAFPHGRVYKELSEWDWILVFLQTVANTAGIDARKFYIRRKKNKLNAIKQGVQLLLICFPDVIKRIAVHHYVLIINQNIIVTAVLISLI